MRETSGIIINDDIFINSSHVVKMEKSKRIEVIKYIGESDSESDEPDNEITYYTIEIYMLGIESPIDLSFENENDRDVIFNKIVMELYGHNYAYVNF